MASAWGANPISSPDNVLLGSARNATGVIFAPFDGLIDEIRIWDHARTQGEIVADMNAQILSAPGLLARYGLNEGVGTTATDSVGALVGTLTNGAAWETVNLPAIGDGLCDFDPIPGCCAVDGDCDDSNDCTDDASAITIVQDTVPDGSQRPEHDQFTQEDIIAGRKTMTITLDQDIHLIRDVQKGMHSRGFTEAWLNDDESRVQHYHTWLDRYMG